MPQFSCLFVGVCGRQSPLRCALEWALQLRLRPMGVDVQPWESLAAHAVYAASPRRNTPSCADHNSHVDVSSAPSPLSASVCMIDRRPAKGVRRFGGQCEPRPLKPGSEEPRTQTAASKRKCDGMCDLLLVYRLQFMGRQVIEESEERRRGRTAHWRPTFCCSEELGKVVDTARCIAWLLLSGSCIATSFSLVTSASDVL